jgi:riboflavin kinase
MKYKGKYVVGLGEGAFFVSLEGYKSQIKEKLGFTPFPGTFNLEVGNEVVQIIQKLKFITIPGFEQGGRKFGSCRIRPAVIRKLPAYLIIPEKTTHSLNIVEFISVFELRKELKIKPGDTLEFEL